MYINHFLSGCVCICVRACVGVRAHMCVCVRECVCLLCLQVLCLCGGACQYDSMSTLSQIPCAFDDYDAYLMSLGE
jgi:hypothetical protein